MNPTHRNQFPAWLKSLGLVGTAVEVGVAEGCYADLFLSEWPHQYVMVDTWRHLDGYLDCMNGPDNEHEQRYLKAMSVASKYKDRCSILRMDSLEASSKFSDRSLSFVYIDADHSFEGCRKDVLAWAPKIKSGGILAGHDYFDMPPAYKVRSVVSQICNGPCGITHENIPSWWVRIG